MFDDAALDRALRNAKALTRLVGDQTGKDTCNPAPVTITDTRDGHIQVGFTVQALYDQGGDTERVFDVTLHHDGGDIPVTVSVAGRTYDVQPKPGDDRLDTVPDEVIDRLGQVLADVGTIHGRIELNRYRAETLQLWRLMYALDLLLNGDGELFDLVASMSPTTTAGTLAADWDGDLAELAATVDRLQEDADGR